MESIVGTASTFAYEGSLETTQASKESQKKRNNENSITKTAEAATKKTNTNDSTGGMTKGNAETTKMPRFRNRLDDNPPDATISNAKSSSGLDKIRKMSMPSRAMLIKVIRCVI